MTTRAWRPTPRQRLLRRAQSSPWERARSRRPQARSRAGSFLLEIVWLGGSQIQFDHYVDIAPSRGFDAVITVSKEWAAADIDHPVPIDRRKLRKVALVHLSCDRIRTEALLRGLGDGTVPLIHDGEQLLMIVPLW